MKPLLGPARAVVGRGGGQHLPAENDVQRAGLQQERERVEEELNRGDLVVVVFGTGSSGKTSLIRALLKEMVGEVGQSPRADSALS